MTYLMLMLHETFKQGPSVGRQHWKRTDACVIDDVKNAVQNADGRFSQFKPLVMTLKFSLEAADKGWKSQYVRTQSTNWFQEEIWTTSKSLSI